MNVIQCWLSSILDDCTISPLFYPFAIDDDYHSFNSILMATIDLRLLPNSLFFFLFLYFDRENCNMTFKRISEGPFPIHLNLWTHFMESPPVNLLILLFWFTFLVNLFCDLNIQFLSFLFWGVRSFVLFLAFAIWLRNCCWQIFVLYHHFTRPQSLQLLRFKRRILELIFVRQFHCQLVGKCFH